MEFNINDQLSEAQLEKIRQQFDFAPFPRVSLEEVPKDLNLLYVHSLVTSYYLRHHQYIETEGKLILDAGCGTGWKSLVLAVANPGATVIGVDISEECIKLARQRLQYHGIENYEFHVLSIEDLPKLGLQFDYINCDEVLYLLPEPASILKNFKSVLKPQGIIRTNLHSWYRRFPIYRAQELFQTVGLKEDNPQDPEIQTILETIAALKDTVDLKVKTWSSQYQGEQAKEVVLLNYLLQGDKGYTIPDLFSMLAETDLDFVSMVNWRHWDILDLFKDPDNLPDFWAMGLGFASIEEQLHLFELLHPIHRLLDFWCAHPQQESSSPPIEEWDASDWQMAQVHLHPQLNKPEIQEDLLQCVVSRIPFEISRYIPVPTKTPIYIESNIASCLLPLWQASRPFPAILSRWLQVQPLNLTTLEPKTESEAFQEITDFLTSLEAFLYVLIEPSSMK